jgi:hypothetical protein
MTLKGWPQNGGAGCSPVISPGGLIPSPSQNWVRRAPDENALGPSSLQPAQVAYLSPDIPTTLLLEEIP